MSKLFTVTTRNGISETQGYFGTSIIDVVEKNILAIGQRAGLGNALADRWQIPIFNLARPDALNGIAKLLGRAHPAAMTAQID